MKNAECATSAGKQVVFVHIWSTSFCYHVVLNMGLRPLASLDRWFKSRSGHGGLSLGSVVCCQSRVEFSVTGRSLFQSSPTECVCVCVCVCQWEWSSATITSYTYHEYVERGQTKKKDRILIFWLFKSLYYGDMILRTREPKPGCSGLLCTQICRWRHKNGATLC